MDLKNILYAVASLTAMGLLFGVILGVAAKVFAVKTDPRIEQITHVLPGANCGGCGFAGCANFADAVVKAGAPTNGCMVGGAKVVARIATIMGQEPLEVVPSSARRAATTSSRSTTTRGTTPARPSTVCRAAPSSVPMPAAAWATACAPVCLTPSMWLTASPLSIEASARAAAPARAPVPKTSLCCARPPVITRCCAQASSAASRCATCARWAAWPAASV